MVAPTTRLPDTTIRVPSSGTCFYWDARQHWRQKKPFTLILPYAHQNGQIVRVQSSGVYNGPAYGADAPPFTPDYIPLQNRSYERLREALYNQASLGVDFVEYRQSVSMIASTAASLGKAALAIKRLRFGEAANHLRMKFIPKGVHPRKSFANNWLDFHFGWEPLVKDIHDALEILVDPVQCFTYKRARIWEPFYQRRFTDFGAATRLEIAKGIAYVQQGARIRAITNANLVNLNRYGVLNPATLAWEAIPFSFVVDWFVNVGAVLSSLSDFAGMALDSTWRSEGYKYGVSLVQQTKSGYTPSGLLVTDTFYSRFDRYTGLSGVTLRANKLKPPSVTRAATAISLLLQQLK